MLLTTVLIVAAAIALAGVFAEIARRARSGRDIEEEMRRTADLAPVGIVLHRSVRRDWNRQAA